jgi:tetratricopeptide (TPR) repeat protein
MTLYVVVTDKCQNDADRHGQSSLADNLRQAIEGTQNLIGFDFFLPSPFLKKSLGRSFRLIAYRAPVADDELILFLRVLARGSNEYEGFLANWDRDTDAVTRQFQPYDEGELKRIHANLTSVRPPPPLPEPDAEERGWLHEVFREETTDDELIVLETEIWVKKMKESANRDFLALYHQMLEQMETSRLHAGNTNAECRVHWESNSRLGVAYLYRPDLKRLLLLEPIRQSDDVDALLEEHGERLRKTGDGQHELSRIAARSYPFLMVLDQDAWLAIQKDEEANLALSPEEAELLESIHRAGAEGELGYPLFINGRAGSGKSTMLQYLAADYVDFALRQSTIHLPLYMTSSRDLLERARETVRGLLTVHHARLLEGAHEPAKVDAVLGRSFRVFHDFLYSLLPPEIQKELPQDRYVNYTEFRRLWARDFAKRPEARRMSPDVSWHAIRSYIKGIRSSHDDELGSEEFNALPRRRRSVSEEAYKQIYDRVWCSWYKRLCDDENYWDDQDLAAHVLDAGVAPETDCAAIFCDEAQDFTPVELDIIFQLSLFGRRSLQPEELRCVPIVFAGDPLQTINPTGFRWDAVQADFHERFCAVLDPRRRARVDLSYRELRFNYRSNPGIVGFCNLIQLVRAALLGARDIRPQEAWWVDAPVQTVWFALDNTQTIQQLQRHPELVKLVNCEEGEETEHVRSDPILKTLNEEPEGIYRNILGPTRAKGLEFPAVVVYRFGESAPGEFARLLSGNASIGDQEERLPFEYFLNRLYVAASRAKGQLVIVDSNRALGAFWRFATDPDVIDRLMEEAGGQTLWKDTVTYLVPGKEEAWSGERVDPREQALDYVTQGRRKRDPYLLRQAALAFRSAGDEHEAGKCLALAAEFEGKLREAGDKYRELGINEDAFRCYWTGRQWRPLCDLSAQDASLTARLESRAADFMAHTDGLDTAFVAGLVSAAKDDAWLKEAGIDATWRDVLSKLADRLSKALGDETITWKEVHSAYGRLVMKGVLVADTHLASIAYAAGDFKKAVSLWERGDSTDRGEYFRAKARLAPYPESLVWLSRLKEYGEVLRQWREHSLEPSEIEGYDEKVILAVADAALDEGDLPLAARMMELRPDRERVVKLLAAALKATDHGTVNTAAVLVARIFVRTRAWTAALRAAEAADFSELPGIRARDVRSVLSRTEGTTKILMAVVEELAMSEELPSETSERQGPVTEFLHRHFIGKGEPQANDHGIPPHVIGSAIERAGKIVDALQYYENLGRNASTAETRRFAAERLVRNLERHAVYFQSRGDDPQARQRELRAQQLRDRAGIGTRALAEYPVMGTRMLSTGSTEWLHGPLRIILSKSHSRLRIEHTKRFETVTVDVKDYRLLGDAEFTQLKLQNDLGFIAWQIEGWNTKVTLIYQDTNKCIIEFNGRPFEVLLE